MRTTETLAKSDVMPTPMLLEMLRTTQASVLDLQFRVAELQEENARLRKKLFGSSAETHKNENSPEDEQQTLFNDVEATAAEEKKQAAENDEETEVKGHIRKKSCGRKPLPEHLERVREVIELTEEDRQCECGGRLEEIDEEITEQAELIPAKAFVKQLVRKKYACPCCNCNVKRAPQFPVPIPKATPAPGLLSVIIHGKYGLHLPLYRIEKELAGYGFDFKRTQLADWVIKVGELIQPLAARLKEWILSRPVIHADETTVQVLGERDKRPESKSYMWCLANGKYDTPAVFFEYHPGRGYDAAQSLLAGFSGIVHSDGYAAYEKMSDQFENRVSCLAHIRRKFHEASKAGSHKGKSNADEILDWIQKLYAIEREAADLPADNRMKLRQEKAKEIFESLQERIEELLAVVTPKSLLGKALGYAERQLPALKCYLDDGRIAIDNNTVENALRPFCLGRKNWLFCQSEAGAETSSMIYSLYVSAMKNGLNGRHYFEHLLKELPVLRDSNRMTSEELDRLLPWNVTLG